jgi:branched-chain amino acid aminotransferase
MIEKVEKIWMDGRLVNWDDAKVHVLTHTLHYGLGAFEGIRAYQLADGRSGVFRLRDHTARLFDSCHLIGLEIPYTHEEINKACVEVLAVNGLEKGYLRPLVYMGYGSMGLFAMDNPTRVSVAAWPWGAYLGDEGLSHGIRARISSFTRHGNNSTLAKGKVCGHYVNSMLAKREAMRDGYQEAIMLDDEGYVSEGTGENLFIVKDNVLITPPLNASILAGITRETIITMARDMGCVVKEERFPRDLLYLADEVFVTGTAAEVTPVREIDGRRVGKGTAGELTMEIQAAYFSAVRGEQSRYSEWVTTYEPQRGAPSLLF